MIIGKLVHSYGHLDYVAQIYGAGEVEVTPQPSHYALGTFVRVALPPSIGGWLVGLICDTTLLNPEFGRLGPRLSNSNELAVFSPDYLHEKAVLVAVMMLGQIAANGQVSQEVPSLAATSDSPVERLTKAQIRTFHGEPDAFAMTYAPRLLKSDSALAIDILGLVLNQLRPLYPHAELQQIFDVISDELRWRRQVTPFGDNV